MTASKLDSTHDIDAHLWYRERGAASPAEPLAPGELVYKAGKKKGVSR